MMFLETALSFAWKHWRLVLGGAVAGVLVVMLLIARGDASHFKKLYESQAQQTASANAKLAVSNASINTLTTALDDKNRESEVRAKAFTDSKTADAQAIAVMDARQKADASRIDTLKRLAASLPDQPGCKVPSAVAAQLDGL